MERNNKQITGVKEIGKETFIDKLHLLSDKVKLKLIEKMPEYDRIGIARTIKNKDIFLEAFKIIPESDYRWVLENKSDDFKTEIFDQIPENYRARVLRTFKDDNKKIQIIEKVPEGSWSSVADSIKSDELIIAIAQMTNDSFEKSEILFHINDNKTKLKHIDEIQISDIEEYIDGIDDSMKMEVLKEVDGLVYLKIAKTLEDENKVNILKECKESFRLNIIGSIQDEEVMFDALDSIKDELGENKIELLKNLYKTNADIIQNIDRKLLDDKYISTLGGEKISVISCYPEIQSRILTLEGKKLDLFGKILDGYIKDGENDEWSIVANEVLKNIESYSDLIDAIDDINSVDISKLTKIMQNNNDFEITTLEDLENFEEIKKQACDEMIEKGDIGEKRKAVIQKIFGQDEKYTKKIIEKYGEDIEHIEDGDVKDYVLCLKELMTIEEETVLEQIYEECEDVGIIDKSFMERSSKNEYGKLFNEGLYQISDKDKIEDKNLPVKLKGLNVYDAGDDFKMIITSVAAYYNNSPEDFKKDWNRPSIASQHFCASYIRNDMMGTAPIRHLCYGFNSMKEDSLMLSGDHDIGSSATGFVSYAGDKDIYYSPNTQINKTESYNEMDFRRIQGGEKKQPDYIVTFKRKGKIDNLDKIVQASEDWEGKLPVVIVDVDRCLESEKDKVKEKIQEFNETRDVVTAKEIIQKVRNNQQTDEKFCSHLSKKIEILKQRIEEMETKEKSAVKDEKNQIKQDDKDNEYKVSKNDLKENYEKTDAKERKETVSAIKNLYNKLKEFKSEERGV